MKKTTWIFSMIVAVATITMIGCQTNKAMRFEEADSDGDGKLSRQEATTAMVQSIINQYDTSDNGQVSAAEWKSWHGNDMKVFNERDTNRDEIVTLQEATNHALKNGTFDKLFDFADKDSDGFISRKEAKEFSSRYYQEVR